MKRVFSSVLAALILMAAPVAKAENITVDQAKNAAAHFMQHNSTLTRLTADQLVLERQWENDELGVPSMYLLVAQGQGWIIITATTVMDPVVGYSDDSDVNAACLPPQMEWWLEGFNEMVCELQKSDAEKPLADSPRWTELANRQLTGTKANVYLLNTKWNQGEPDGLEYNMMCPTINDTVCPTGCVATAMAQICKYYEYPIQPVGNKTYRYYYTVNGSTYSKLVHLFYEDSAAFDYSLMPNKFSAPPSQANYAQRLEVSRIGYYLGTSVEMQYAPDGSGSSSELVAPAMRDYFKYKTGSYILRDQVGSSTFLSRIRADLTNKYPVYMSGASSTGSDAHSAGHAWVCDGIQESNETHYHMNWGWGGSGNGWFNLSENNMAISGMSYNFNRRQGAVVGMTPPADSLLAIRSVEIDASLGNAYPNPASVSVTLPYRLGQAAELNVYSADGRLVESRRLAAGRGEVTLSTEAYPAGIYVYRVGNAHGRFVVR